MKTTFFSIIATGAIFLASSTPAIAANDSIKSAEQRIERLAKELAAESIELATQEVKKARQKSNDIKSKIDKRLDDTIINGKAIRDQYNNNNELLAYKNARFDAKKELIEECFIFVEKLGKGILAFFAILTILIFIGVYLNRRQKYKIIEKAIENNYPLPPGFISKNVRPTSTTIQHIHYSQTQAQNGSIPIGSKKTVKEFKVSDWANFHSGIKWCAWGLAFMFFFLLVDAPIWVFAIIPIITGIGKLYSAYKIQQASKDAKEYTSSTSEDTDVPTPPPFDNKNDNNPQN